MSSIGFLRNDRTTVRATWITNTHLFASILNHAYYLATIKRGSIVILVFLVQFNLVAAAC